MKKHLIAAAIASAFAVPALAQNVTISGYVESGFADSKVGDAPSTSRLADSTFGSSRVVISGSEDLGGGLKAGFRLESTVAVSTGRFGGGQTTTQTDSTGYFNRGAEINLSGAFGMVRLGKFDHVGAEDNDLNVIGNTALFTGTSTSDYGFVTASVEAGSDRDGTIAYRTPTMPFGYIEIAYTPKDQAADLTGSSSTVAAVDDNGIKSIHARGAINGVNYRVGVANFQTAAGAKDEIVGLGLSYDFGAASVSVAYQSYDAVAADTDRTETVVTANVPMGNGLDLRLLHKAYKHDVTANDATTNGIGFAKALSKRTNVLGMYRTTDKKAAANADQRQVYIGVGHSF
jgi:predicted porin